MYDELFAIRLAKLRAKLGVSARDMSLSLGQNPGYINQIENKKALPSMAMFFVICDYLKVTPVEFFDTEIEDPEIYRALIKDIRKLTSRQISYLAPLISDLIPH